LNRNKSNRIELNRAESN